MEDYHKNNYYEYRKNQFKIKESFDYNKNKHNGNIYKYNKDNIQKKNKINKDIQKTSFNHINLTEKNNKITDLNRTILINQNYIKNMKNANTAHIHGKNINHLSEKDENNNEIISNSRQNILSHLSNKNKLNSNNNVLHTKNNNFIPKSIFFYNNMNNPNKGMPHSFNSIPYYNNIVNNMNYNYHNYFPKTINNSINNYYINQNIVLYNDINQYQNIYQNYNNNQLSNAVINPYLSGNYYNNILFARNEDDIKTKNNNIIDSKKENTCILEINLKFSEDKNHHFKLRRFDDLFETVQIFCQINELNSNFYIPIIIYIMKALNSIYGVFNIKLNQKEINELQFLKYFYYNSNDE